MAVNKFDNSMFDAGTIGTTANKLVQLDGSAKIPAVDGSLLTGIPSSFTKSASDPAIGTNPSGGVGTIWVNTTSGETYCCTTATAGANVWTNVGAGTDNIPVNWDYGGTLNGYHHGGYTTGSGSNLIQYYSFTSDGSAVDSTGNLTSTTAWTSAASNGDHTYGYRLGGWSGLNVIDKYQFGTGNDATDVGDCVSSGNHGTGNASATYAYTIGGSPSTIEKTAFASDANATSVGTGGRGHGSYTGWSSTTHGYAAGGGDGVSQIDKWTFASDANAVDIGDLTIGGYGAGGHSSDSAGYRSGGYSTPSYFNIIEKMPFATETTVDHGADLTRSPDTAGSNSSLTNGYSCGGAYGGFQSDIDKFPFATSTNATDIGNLVLARTGLNGCGQ